MAMKAWPSFVGFGESSTQLLTPLMTAAPVSTAVRISTITASPYPLCPAIGNCAPFSGYWLGSVVGMPSSSTSQLSGICLPSALAEKILVAATALVAISR